MWWLGMVAYGKNFDHKEHEATLHIMKPGSNDILGSQIFNLKNGEPGAISYKKSFKADGKTFIITVRPENYRYYEDNKDNGITYPDYYVNVTEE